MVTRKMTSKESTMWLVFVAIFYLGLAYGSTRPDPFMRQRPPQLQGRFCDSVVTANGYPCKDYQVTSEDGYILTLINIAGGHVKSNGSDGRRQPVLLQHGILADGASWLVENPNVSLGYVLADNGFDVWIANARGTRWSRGHTSLNPANPAYWAWSWDELAEYELPAIVGFVKNQTGQKVHYVGHSLGTLTALASFSEGKLVDMVKSAALLSPIAYVSHITTALGQLAARAFLGEILSDLLRVPEFDPLSKVASDAISMLCARPGVNCNDLTIALTAVRDGVVMKFDYGPAENIFRYRQPVPPVYDMSKIPNNLPMFLSYGGQDALADPVDVQILLNKLKSHDSDKLTVQFVENFAHADFIIGFTTKSVVYDPMMAFFNRHTT